jgi:hypothetical protein
MGASAQPVLPGSFIAWGHRMGFDFTEEVANPVGERGGVIADWKTAHDKIKIERDEFLDAFQVATDDLACRKRLMKDLSENVTRLFAASPSMIFTAARQKHV